MYFEKVYPFTESKPRDLHCESVGEISVLHTRHDYERSVLSVWVEHIWSFAGLTGNSRSLGLVSENTLERDRYLMKKNVMKNDENSVSKL